MLKQIAINLKPSRADPQLPQAGLQDFKEHLAKNPIEIRLRQIQIVFRSLMEHVQHTKLGVIPPQKNF